MDYYELNVCGLIRKLPLIQVGRNTKIASFSILGDVELVDKLADEIAFALKDYTFDYIVGPEVKAVPLIHGVAKRLGHKRFVICRKSIKPYMVNPVGITPLSHFPKHAKPLVLNGEDASFLRDKKVFVVDDVISSGITMRMMNHLMDKVGAQVVGIFAAIKQGDQLQKFENLHYLLELPIFKTERSD